MKKLASVLIAFTVLVSAPSIAAENNNFIVNGRKVAKDEAPWQVRLFFGEDDQEGFCGGSIIANRWILTAAHCLVDFISEGSDIEDSDVLTPDTDEEAQSLFVGYGDHRLKDLGRLKAEYIAIHPEYLNGRGPDVGLIKVDRPLPSGLVISLNLGDVEPAPGDTVYVTGWGALRDENFDPSILLVYNMINGPQIRKMLREDNIDVPEEMRVAELKIVDPSSCAEVYKKLSDPRMEIKTGEICAAEPTAGRDSCYGDSGGPLYMRDSNGKAWQVGIVSWGYQCGNPFFPGVYANPAQFSNWIDQTMSSN